MALIGTVACNSMSNSGTRARKNIHKTIIDFPFSRHHKTSPFCVQIGAGGIFANLIKGVLGGK